MKRKGEIDEWEELNLELNLKVDQYKRIMKL